MPEDIDAEAVDAARDGRARLLIAEIYTTPERLAAYYGVNGCGAQLPSNFGLLGAPWKSDVIHQRIDEYMRAIPAGRWPNWAIGNHDNSRLATRLGPAAARAAAVLLLTLPGTPTIYYGDEIGMHDVPIPPQLVRDPAEKQQPGLGLGRDPERTPMQWSSAPNGGFTTGTPWLPVAADFAAVNVATEQRDSSSTLTLYRRLLALRRSAPAFSRGAFKRLPRQGDVVAYLRGDASTGRYLVLVNVGPGATSYAITAADLAAAGVKGRRGGRIVAGSRERATGPGKASSIALEHIALEGNEAVVVRLQ
jgi:alpha-glucosidase